MCRVFSFASYFLINKITIVFRVFSSLVWVFFENESFSCCAISGDFFSLSQLLVAHDHSEIYDTICYNLIASSALNSLEDDLCVHIFK